jgi:hypothetical protein
LPSSDILPFHSGDFIAIFIFGVYKDITTKKENDSAELFFIRPALFPLASGFHQTTSGK